MSVTSDLERLELSRDGSKAAIESSRSVSGRMRRSRKWQKMQRTKGGDLTREAWQNDVYYATCRRYDSGWPLDGGPYAVIGISSHDGEARHDWRDFQWIKNDLCGEEWEGIELFPAESRLQDPSNYYRLWCAPKIPIGGFEGRLIADEKTCIAPQRGWWK